MRRAASILLAGALIAAAVLARPHPPGDTASAALLGRSGSYARALAGAAGASAAASSAGAWSAPATLSACPGSSPRVLFPSDAPSERTGPGAIVWSDGQDCQGGPGARVSALGAQERPLAPKAPRGAGGRRFALRAPLGAAAGPHGQIVIAGFPAPADSHGTGTILQGAADGPFAALASRTPLSKPFNMSTAYLGDVAVALPDADGRHPLVQVERFFSDALGRPRVVAASGAAGPIQALTIAMDYRSDALAAWVQGSSVYAQDLPSSGVWHPVQRIGKSGSSPSLTALLSDDNRGMVAWEDRDAKQVSVHFDYSATGVKFGPPTLLESFAEPDGLPAPAASPRLIRLSSESVMLAWAGASAGRWVVRTAAVDQNGIGQASTIAAPEGDALLDGLTAGPRGEALVLFSAPQADLMGHPDPARQVLYAARGVDTSPDRTSFAAAQPIAPAGPLAGASIGIDPDTDAAVAVWSGAGGEIDYSVHPPG